jgi:hypothetical protein
VEELGRLMLWSYPPEALSLAESKRKEVSMFEKGLVATGQVIRVQLKVGL